MPHEEWRDIERMLKDQGWTVNFTGSGHIRCLPPDKEMAPVFLSATPSDWRAMRNNIRDLKKSGFRYPPDATDSPAPDPPDSDDEVLGDWQQLLPAGLVFEGAVDDVAVAVKVLVGKAIQRIDRVDPRDPKTVVAVDADAMRIILRDRHQRKIAQSIREFSRDLRKGLVEFVDPEQAREHELPEVGGLRFHDALRTLRQASGLSHNDLAQVISEDGSCWAESIELWERATDWPGRKHYQALCTLWPGLSRACPPKKYQAEETMSDPEPNANGSAHVDSADRLETLYAAAKQLVCSWPAIKHYQTDKGTWHVLVLNRGHGHEDSHVELSASDDSLGGAISQMFAQLQERLEKEEEKVREQERKLAQQRAALAQFTGAKA